MARSIDIARRSSRRNWEDLSEDYRKRLARYGITPSYYESGGKIQRARGHLPREHVTRRERNPTGFTSGDYRFLKNQMRRAKKIPDEFRGSVAAYKRLSVKQRARLRDRVARDHREYKRHKSVSGIVRGEGTSGLKKEFDNVFVGGDEGYDEIDVESYEDNFPDFDDDYAALMFYH